MRAGDSIMHVPTNSIRTMACWDRRPGWLFPTDPPFDPLEQKDCYVTRSATETEHRRALVDLATDKVSDFRSTYALDDLAKLKVGSGLRVYIAGPISKGSLHRNIERATAAFFELMRHGFSPFCPQWSVFSDHMFVSSGRQDLVVSIAKTFPRGSTHGDWMQVDLPWVDVAHAVLRIDGPSEGADLEVARAKMNGIPVFTWDRWVIEWAAKRPIEPF